MSKNVKLLANLSVDCIMRSQSEFMFHKVLGCVYFVLMVSERESGGQSRVMNTTGSRSGQQSALEPAQGGPWLGIPKFC